MLFLIFMIVAAILFVVSAFPVASRVNLMSLGLAAMAMAFVTTAWPGG